jgi:hypothetical protein
MISGGKLLVTDTPQGIKNSMMKQILELQCSDSRKAYRIISSETGFETQLFGDRIDTVIENTENDSGLISGLLRDNRIRVLNIRIKPVTLENVFIHLLKST